MTKNPEWYTDDAYYLKKYCPRQVYHFFFAKDYSEFKEVFLNGQFGESLLLGLTASGDAVSDLRKHKKSGAMRKDEERIRGQAKITKILFKYHKIDVHEGMNTQVPLCAHIERDVYIKTRLDLFPSLILFNPKDVNDYPKIAAIDIKFPKALDGFGDYDWSNFDHMDHCQPISIYSQFQSLIEKPDLSEMKKFFPKYEKEVGFDNIYTPTVMASLNEVMFYYFIIAYDKVTDENILIKPYPKEVDDMLAYEERTKRTIALLEYHFENGFDPIPYIDTRGGRGCHKCPINKKEFPKTGYCEDFIDIEDYKQ